MQIFKNVIDVPFLSDTEIWNLIVQKIHENAVEQEYLQGLVSRILKQDVKKSVSAEYAELLPELIQEKMKNVEYTDSDDVDKIFGKNVEKFTFERVRLSDDMIKEVILRKLEYDKQEKEYLQRFVAEHNSNTVVTGMKRISPSDERDDTHLTSPSTLKDEVESVKRLKSPHTSAKDKMKILIGKVNEKWYEPKGETGMTNAIDHNTPNLQLYAPFLNENQISELIKKIILNKIKSDEDSEKKSDEDLATELIDIFFPPGKFRKR